MHCQTHMARLLLQSENVPVQAIELRLGVNRLGRSETNDFPLDHASVSTRHCEIVLSEEGLVVRDCSSTNGTLINGKPIKEAPLLQGQVLQIGGLEFFVENTEVTVAIPQFEMGRPTPPIVLEDGTMLCPRHPDVRVWTPQCIRPPLQRLCLFATDDHLREYRTQNTWPFSDLRIRRHSIIRVSPTQVCSDCDKMMPFGQKLATICFAIFL